MLALENVTKVYRPGERPALDGVRLKIEKGELVALLGPSGAGKSSLIRVLNGLVRPDSGTVTVDGQDLTRMDERQLQAVRRKIGMIFQEFHLIERLPVVTNVVAGAFGRYSFWRAALRLWNPGDVAEARRLLAQVGLEGFEAALARELSGGQRQRVAIARAMMQHPLVLLGDEPFASLDPVTARSVMDLVLRLSREQGLTTVLSLHDVALAREFCPRAVGLRAGKIVYDGPMDGLTEQVMGEIYAGDLGEESAGAGDRSSVSVALGKGCGKPKAPTLAQS